MNENILKPKKCSENLPQFLDAPGFTGVAYGDTHNFELKETFLAKLEVIKCKDCGRESISWERYNPSTPGTL